MKLRNDKVLIFGGGSGIGKAVAKRFCDSGANVIVLGRNEEKLKKAKEEIKSEKLYYKTFDISDVDKHTNLFYECEKRIGKISGFVNAAAFAWGGAAGAYLFIDRENKITAFDAQHVLNSPVQNLRQQIIPIIQEAFK